MLFCSFLLLLRSWYNYPDGRYGGMDAFLSLSLLRAIYCKLYTKVFQVSVTSTSAIVFFLFPKRIEKATDQLPPERRGRECRVPFPAWSYLRETWRERDRHHHASLSLSHFEEAHFHSPLSCRHLKVERWRVTQSTPRALIPHHNHSFSLLPPPRLCLWLLLHHPFLLSDSTFAVFIQSNPVRYPFLILTTIVVRGEKTGKSRNSWPDVKYPPSLLHFYLFLSLS